MLTGMLQIECTSSVKPSHPSCTELLGKSLDYQKVGVRPVRYFCMHCKFQKRMQLSFKIRSHFMFLCCNFYLGGTQLHRGYCYEATMDDKPADISHLVFVIHGIGQMMETSSIVKSCNV